MTKTRKQTDSVPGTTDASGSSLTAWDKSETGQMCHAFAQQQGIGLTEAAQSLSAWMEIFARQDLRLHKTVPVCTNCRSEVDALARESLARLDGPLTEQSAAMIAKARDEASLFVAGLEERGVKV